MKPIHLALRELMDAKGLHEHLELATAADVTPATVSRYLSGRRGTRINSQALRTVEKLAPALGVAPEYFLEYRQAKAEKLVREAMADGLISLEALEMLVEGARVRRGTTKGDSEEGEGT